VEKIAKTMGIELGDGENYDDIETKVEIPKKESE